MGYMAIVLMIQAVHTDNRWIGMLSLILGFFALMKDVFGE